MNFRMGVLGVGMGILALLPVSSLTSAQNKPAPPAMVIPSLEKARVEATCVECDMPFDTMTHKEILQGLAANSYIAELRLALYNQDTVHQFESKAHFDNCDFDSATAYITSLLTEVNEHVQRAMAARQSVMKEDINADIQNAFFALGQAMHATQDFYAHTNYVELIVSSVKNPDDIEVIEPWTELGRTRISQLRQKGLISGFVFWGFPQRCASGTPSHAQLAKDSADSNSGKQLISHLQNLSQYRIAVFLARKASIALMRHAFQRWPLLQKINGNNAAFEVILDRRGV